QHALRHTYILPAEVAKQDGGGFPKIWGTKDGKAVEGFYAMLAPPAGRGKEAIAGELERALRSIPTLSIALAPDSLFGAATGIYAHPEEHGRDWERDCSVEL